MTKDAKAKRDVTTLSARQRAVLGVIRKAVKDRGYPPSIREIGDAVGLNSTSSVAYQLKELERKGFLRRDPNKPRAVDVRLDEPEESETTANGTEAEARPQVPEGVAAPTYVPIVGSIAAGSPILAEQNIEEYMGLPEELVGQGELFMLRIVGDSMIDMGIYDGDWVVVRSQNVAENGEVIAAMIDGEATCKEWSEDSSGKWLIPHNEEFEPIRAEHATILGKVVTVLRRL